MFEKNIVFFTHMFLNKDDKKSLHLLQEAVSVLQPLTQHNTAHFSENLAFFISADASNTMVLEKIKTFVQIYSQQVYISYNLDLKCTSQSIHVFTGVNREVKHLNVYMYVYG